MKLESLGPALLLSSIAICSCGTPPRAEDTLRFLQHTQPDVESLRVDVAWLADDAREGRRAGSAGELAAANYIAQRFDELRLEPAGENGAWFQEFEVPLPARDGGHSSLITHKQSGPVLLDSAKDLVPLFCSDGGPVAGRAWFADYGIVNKDCAWDSYRSLDLAGGILLIVRGTPPDALRGQPEESGDEAVAQGHGWGSSGSIFHKVMTAKRYGAGGVLIVQHPDRADEALLPFDPGQIGRAGIPCAMLSSAGAEQLFPGYAEAVRAVDRGESSGAHPVGEQRFVTEPGRGVALELRADVVRENAMAHNVLARRRGAIPGRTVLVGAHFDHLGHGGEGSLAPAEQGEIHNGADDNASGTACVMELARLLSQEWIPDGDVVFALWSGEELGLLGSEHWMRNPTFDLNELRANINLDMVGRCDDGVLQVLGAGTSPRFAAWMAPAGAFADLKLEVSLSGQGDGGSDHQTFLRREIPALHLFSGTHNDYHKPSDDFDKVEFDGMRRVVLLCLDFMTRVHTEPYLSFSEVSEEKKAVERRRTSGARFGSVPSYIPDERGLVLDGTSPGGPAEAAGLLAGDILTEVGNVEIGTIHDFVFALQTYKPGNVVRVRYLRDGELLETRVTLTSNQAE